MFFPAVYSRNRMFITLLIGQAVIIILLICALVHWVRKRNRNSSANAPLDGSDPGKTNDEVASQCKYLEEYEEFFWIQNKDHIQILSENQGWSLLRRYQKGGGGELGGTDGRKGFKLCKKYHRSAFLNTSYINNIIVIYKTFQT